MKIIMLGAPGAGKGTQADKICAKYNIPCAQIRAISNYVDDAREQWDIATALKELTATINRLF